MVQNGRGNNSRISNGRKRKQFNNKVNAKKFKPNYRNSNGGHGPIGQRDQQRDFARDYIDFETFDDFNDSSSRSFYPPQQRPMGMVPVIPPYPYRDSRPLLPLPPVPPMYGPGPGPRRPLHPPPMPPPHMRRMGPPMPMMPLRPLLPRPHPAAYGPMRPFGPPGLMRPGMGPRHGQRLMSRGHQGNRAGKRPGQKQHNNKGNAKKQKKKGGKKITPTPPQELNDMTKPWITDEIREANAKKIELNKLASKAATPDPELWKEFWQAREKVKAMVQAARLEYIGSHPEEDVDKILSEAKTKGEGQNGDAAEIKTASGETKIGNVVSLSQSFVKTDTLHTVKSENDNDNDNLAENGGGDTVADSCNIKTEPVDAPNQGQGDQVTVSEVAKNTPIAQIVTVAKQVIKQSPQTLTKAAVKAPPAPVQQPGQAQISKVIPNDQTPQAKPVQGVKPTPATPIKSTPPATAQVKLTPAVQTKTVTIAQSKPVNTATVVTKPTTAAPTVQVVKPAVVKSTTPTVVKPTTPTVVKPTTPTVVKPTTPTVVKPATPAVAKPAPSAVSAPAKIAPTAAKVITPAAAIVATSAAKVVPVPTDVTANVVPTVAAPTEQAKPATPKPAVATTGTQPKAAAAVTPAPKAPIQNKTPQNKPQTATRGRGGNARGGQFNNRGGRANPYNTRTRMTSNDGYNKRGYY